MGVCPTKATRMGRSNTLHWVFVLPRHCGGAYVMHFSGFLSHQGPTVGPRQCVAVVVCPPRPYAGAKARHCSGCFSHQGPAVGHRQHVAMGLFPTKALRWGLGSVL